MEGHHGYFAGDKVLSPAGDVVSAKANFTSGASFSATNSDYRPLTPQDALSDAVEASGGTPPATAVLLPAKPQKQMIQTFQTGHELSVAGTLGGSPT